MRVSFRTAPPPPHAPPQSAAFAATVPTFHDSSPAGFVPPPPAPERPYWDGSGPRFEAPGIFISNLAGPRPPKQDNPFAERKKHVSIAERKGARRRRRKPPPAAQPPPAPAHFPVNKTIAYKTNAQSYVDPALGWPSAYPKLAIHGVEQPEQKSVVGTVVPPELQALRGATPWLAPPRTIASAPVRQEPLPTTPFTNRSARSGPNSRNAEGWPLGEVRPPTRHELPPSVGPTTRMEAAVGAWGPSRGGGPRMHEQLPPWSHSVPTAPIMRPFFGTDTYRPRKQEDPSRPFHGFDTQPFSYYHVPDPYTHIYNRAANKVSNNYIDLQSKVYQYYPSRPPHPTSPTERERALLRFVPLTQNELDPVPYFQVPSQRSTSATTKSGHSKANSTAMTSPRCYLKSIVSPTKQIVSGPTERPGEVKEENTEKWCKPEEKKCCKMVQHPANADVIPVLPPPPYQFVSEPTADAEDSKGIEKVPLSLIYGPRDKPTATKCAGVRPVLAAPPCGLDRKFQMQPQPERPYVERYMEIPLPESRMLPDGTSLIPPRSDHYSINKFLLNMQGVRGSEMQKECKYKMPRMEPPRPSKQFKKLVQTWKSPSRVGRDFENSVRQSRYSFKKRATPRLTWPQPDLENRQVSGSKPQQSLKPREPGGGFRTASTMPSRDRQSTKNPPPMGQKPESYVGAPRPPRKYSANSERH